MKNDVFNKFDEIHELLDKAVDKVHACERYNGWSDGYDARMLIDKVKKQLRNLEKELKK